MHSPLAGFHPTLIGRFSPDPRGSSGTVAFMGVFSGGTGVFTQNALLVQAGDAIGGQTLTSFSYPVINDSGVVAFFATNPGGAGLFTQKEECSGTTSCQSP